MFHVWYRKLESVIDYNPVLFDDELCCFDKIHACDRQTDGQTNTALQQNA